jgi:protein required for attachment to host cells
VEEAVEATWILVADGVRARLFSPTPEGDSLTQLEDFSNPDGRKPGAAYDRDRAPRTMESMGNSSHAIQPHTTAEHKVAERFARELCEALERGRVDHRFTRLILAAPPRFLGTLRQALGKQLDACVVGQLHKDLTSLPTHEIRSRLSSFLPDAQAQANAGA